MTAIEYKTSAIDLINSIDVNDKDLLQKVWDVLKKMVPQRATAATSALSKEQKEALAELDDLEGIFSACSVGNDWKIYKERYLMEKYGSLS